MALALVNYSSSSDSESCKLEKTDENYKPKAKQLKCLSSRNKCKRLPLPAAIKNMCTDVHKKPFDNPEKHNGRVRSFEHERGNWASYVYIPVNLDLIEDLKTALESHFKNSSVSLELKSIDDVHISLTKTLVLQHHWIKSFSDASEKVLAKLNEFTLRLRDLKVYCNEEKTRTFIGWSVEEMFTTPLIEITEKLDNILMEYKLPKFYEDPSFHASLMWCVGNCKTEIETQLEKFKFFEENSFDCDDMTINIRDISFKCGYKQFKYALAKS